MNTHLPHPATRAPGSIDKRLVAGIAFAWAAVAVATIEGLRAVAVANSISITSGATIPLAIAFAGVSIACLFAFWKRESALAELTEEIAASERRLVEGHALADRIAVLGERLRLRRIGSPG